jgi:hypothetical protein
VFLLLCLFLCQIRDELGATSSKHQQQLAHEAKLVSSLRNQMSEAKHKAEREEKRAAEALAAVAVSNARASEEKERADRLEKRVVEATTADQNKLVAMEKKWSDAERERERAVEAKMTDKQKLADMERQWQAAEKTAANSSELERVKAALASKQTETENLQADVEDLQANKICFFVVGSNEVSNRGN